MSATTTACVAATTAVAARVTPGARAPASRVARAVRPRRSVVVRAQESSISEKLELTAENVELVLDEVRPYLIADGGDVELVEIDGLVVRLKLNGACGSCPSSTTTMRMGIEKRLLEKIPEIMEVEQVTSEEAGLDLTEENVEATLDEIRPYLAGTGGGGRFGMFDSAVQSTDSISAAGRNCQPCLLRTAPATLFSYERCSCRCTLRRHLVRVLCLH